MLEINVFVSVTRVTQDAWNDIFCGKFISLGNSCPCCCCVSPFVVHHHTNSLRCLEQLFWRREFSGISVCVSPFVVHCHAMPGTTVSAERLFFWK